MRIFLKHMIIVIMLTFSCLTTYGKNISYNDYSAIVGNCPNFICDANRQQKIIIAYYKLLTAIDQQTPVLSPSQKQWAKNADAKFSKNMTVGLGLSLDNSEEYAIAKLRVNLKQALHAVSLLKNDRTANSAQKTLWWVLLADAIDKDFFYYLQSLDTKFKVYNQDFGKQIYGIILLNNISPLYKLILNQIVMPSLYELANTTVKH